MSEISSPRDRYLELIEQIIQATLKGKIRSKEQVYQMLVEGIHTGSGEIFERCLQDRLEALQQQANTETDELKQAKATRSLRAFQTIQSEWNRWQIANQAIETTSRTIEQIVRAEPDQRLTEFLRAVDPNREQALTAPQLRDLALALLKQAESIEDPALQQDLQQLADGVLRGLESWKPMQDNLVSWVYESGREIGFGGSPRGQIDPWSLWAQHLTSPFPLALFRTLSLEQSVIEFASQVPSLETRDWVELIILLQFLQYGLITWFDRLIYDSKTGSKLSISTFLAFAIIWSQLARGLEEATALNSVQRRRLADSAFQVSLQSLRVFSQRPYFPLYGGVFAAFPGSRLRSVVNYLDEPLKRVEGTQEKARILTLLGSSERAQGLLDRAREFYEIAREIAAEADDRPCEVANLNHLSRTYATQKNFSDAIHYSQRALIFSRQTGDRPGEANALVNLGYSEVLQAHEREQSDPEVYEAAIGYLQQGLKLAEQLGDRQSQAFGFNSLGIAYIVLDQPAEAVTALIEGLKAAQIAGDLYLQGLDLAYLAEAYYRQQNLPQAIYTGCLGMYYLERIAARDWRQPAGLLTVLQGQMGEAFQATLEQLRTELVAAIGLDGYDYLPVLLEQYRHPGN